MLTPRECGDRHPTPPPTIYVIFLRTVVIIHHSNKHCGVHGYGYCFHALSVYSFGLPFNNQPIALNVNNERFIRFERKGTILYEFLPQIDVMTRIDFVNFRFN